MKAKIVLLGMMLSTHAFAQTTKHGIASAWYQSPKAAASITGAVSLTNYVRGSVANSMVVKSNGTVVIFYRHNGQNKWVQSSDNGNTWTSLGALPASAATGLSSITADIDPNNNIYIAWKSGEFSLGFSKFNGTSWSSPYTINAQTQTASDTISFSQISTDRKGRIHLMWQQGNHQNYNARIKSTCWYARSTDGGNTFSSPVLLSQGNTYHAAFPVADFGGTAHDTLIIAWRENVNGGTNTNNWNWDVKARITYNGGATWNNVFTLEGSTSPTDDDQWDPNVIVDKNGVLHAFYHVYHNATIPDLNANVMYKYSFNGGNTWSTPTQLSTTNIRSHLIKTAYDYTNNAVWCTWKDEMDFGKISGNPQADLKAVYIVNTGTPVISSQEFLCDHLSEETALHNFKVGNDGIMRATYNLSKMAGGGDTIFYTQRTTLNTVLGMMDDSDRGYAIQVFPNPSNDFVYLDLHEEHKIEKANLYSIQGTWVSSYTPPKDKIYLPDRGVYIIEIISSRGKRMYKKIIRQ